MKRIATVLVILLAVVGVLSIATGYTRDGSGSDSKAILVALEALIAGESGATHDSAAAAVGPQTMGAYDSTFPTAVADGDAVRTLYDQYGRPRIGWEPDDWQASVSSADASSTELVIKAGTASKKIAVQWIKVSCDVALDVTIEDESDNVLDLTYCAAKSGYVFSFPLNKPFILDTADKDIQVQTSGAGKIAVTAGGYLYP